MRAVLFVLDLEGIRQIPTALLTKIILLNGLVSLLTAYFFRRYGFLAAVGIHFWIDIAWHVIWGVVA